MKNGNLVRTPLSEVNATLEVLDTVGVTSDDLTNLRSADETIRATVAKVLKRDSTAWKLLEIERDQSKLGLVLAFMRGAAEIVMKKIAVWLRAKVGGLSKDEIIAKLDNVDAGNGLTFKLSDWARNMLGREEYMVMEKAEEADFVTACPLDLGFTENPTTTEFFDEKKLAEYDLELCRPDDGPSLRRAYTSQPDGEWLPIGMKPVYSDGRWLVFFLERNGSSLWLFADCNASPEFRWALDSRVVFRVRKVQS